MKLFKRWGMRRRQFQSAEMNALQQPAASRHAMFLWHAWVG